MKVGQVLYFVGDGDEPDEPILQSVRVAAVYDGYGWYIYGREMYRVEWRMAPTEAEAWKRERERRAQAVRDAESRLYNLDLFLESNRDR